MKKIFSIISAMALLAVTSCEDVPAPYEINNQGGTSTTIYSETFASSLGKFTNYTTDGAGEWVNDYSTAKAAGYDNATKTTTEGTYYLVSPEIDLTGIDSAYVTYDYILRYNKGDENQQLLISDAFDAQNPATGWTVLNQTHTEGADWSTFSNVAKNIPAEFTGKKIRIALKYTCPASGSTWEVKNFKVLKGQAGAEPEPTPTEGLYFQAFTSDFGKCQNYTTSGEGAWVIDYSTAKATGYDNTSKKTTAGTYYLVTPEISLDAVEQAYVEYIYILRYNKGDENQQLLISTTWNEANPADGWTVLNQKNTEGSDWTTFTTTQVQIPTEFLGKNIRLAFRYNTNATSGSTWEVQSVGVYQGEAGTGGDDPTPTPSEGTGSGTQADPYNVAAITSICASGSIPTTKVYAKGKVSKIKEISTSYGNATYYISDDGTETNQFYVYRGYNVGNTKFKSESDLKVGDEVVVYGQLVDYNGTKEFTQGNYIYSLNGSGGTGGEDTGDVKTVTIAEFNAASEGSQYYQLTGKVSGLQSGDIYGNFTLTDETGSVYVYGLLSAKGGSKQQFQSLVSSKGIIEGCTLTIIGQRGSYNSTIEVVNAYFVSISGGGTPGGEEEEEVSGISLSEFTNGGFESWTDDTTPALWKSTTTASNATLAKSTDAHSGSYSVQIEGTTKANKRLSSTEIALEAGTYNVKFYAKSASGSTASVRPGYTPVSGGKVGNYDYDEDYTDNLSSEEWVEINHSFTLEKKTTVNLVIMNSKNPGGTLLIDDYTISKQ